MYRRCYILDNLAAFNYNQGVGVMRNGKETDTTELGSTLMKAMISEVKEFCNFTDKHLWAKKGHYQVQQKLPIDSSHFNNSFLDFSLFMTSRMGAVALG